MVDGGTTIGEGAVPRGGGGTTIGDGAVPRGGGGTTMGDGAVPRGGGGTTMGDGAVPRGGGGTTMGDGLVPGGGGGTVLRGGSGKTTCAAAGAIKTPTAMHSNVSEVLCCMARCSLRLCGGVSIFQTMSTAPSSAHHANSRISFTSAALLIERGLARTGP